MTATAALLGRLSRLGVRLGVDEAGRIVYRAPRGALTEDLRAAIVRHKADVVRALQGSEALEEFPFEGRVIAALIHSQTLGGQVWLVADPEALEHMPPPGKAPWFLFAEIPALRDGSASALKALAFRRCHPSARQALH